MFAPEIPSLITVFFAGILTFLSPCIFPLIPGYISFMSGESLGNMQGENNTSKKVIRLKAFLGALFFGLGFSIVFVALGASATTLGSLLKEYQVILAQIGGAIVIIFGLHMLGVFKINFLLKTKKINYKKHSYPFYVEAFILGMVFVLGWTPCIGPILTGVIAIASQEQTVVQGMVLLFFYSLGLWIPFLISALAVNEVMVLIKKTGKYLIWIERIAGILLILIGLVLLFDKMTALTAWFTRIFYFLPALG